MNSLCETIKETQSNIKLEKSKQNISCFLVVFLFIKESRCNISCSVIKVCHIALFLSECLPARSINQSFLHLCSSSAHPECWDCSELASWLFLHVNQLSLNAIIIIHYNTEQWSQTLSWVNHSSNELPARSISSCIMSVIACFTWSINQLLDGGDGGDAR